MGLKKWLGLGSSASQPGGFCIKDSEVDEQRPQTQRRHTTWEMPSRAPNDTPTRQAVQIDNRFNSNQQHEHRFSSDVRNKNDLISTMVTAMQSPPSLDETDSDVSVGADDDFIPPTALATRVVRSHTTTAIPTARTSERNNGSTAIRLSQRNVLSQSEKRPSATIQVPENIATAELMNHQASHHNVHNLDLALRSQDDEMDVAIQGWLEEWGQQFQTWNWRFFVLRNNGVLSYYTDETVSQLKGSIDLKCASTADVSKHTTLIDKTYVFDISTPQRNLLISAPSQLVMTKWIAQLQVAGKTPIRPLDAQCKTVKFNVPDTVCDHEWKRYDDLIPSIRMEGFLLKRGHVNKNWKNRFFRIEQGELRYYTENQSERKGSVPLKDTIVSPGMAQCPDGRKNYFVLTSMDSKFEMHFNAHDEKSMHSWIKSLEKAQIALGEMTGNKETRAGLSLVIKRAEEIPLGKIEVVYQQAEDFNLEMHKRAEALIAVSCPRNHGIALGSQLISVDGRSILRETYTQARKLLRASSFPLQLEFLLPPYKRGVLIKKSRSGIENWKKRVVVVTQGEIHYYKQVLSFIGGKKAPAELKHRKSFSLLGCYLNLVPIPDRDLCIVVARSPSDKLVLQTSTEEERMEWASVIYCTIRMVSQGITSGHIENLHLEQSFKRTKVAAARGTTSSCSLTQC